MINLGKYNKFIIAVVGMGIAVLVQRYGATNEWVQWVILGATALGVYQIGNDKPPTSLE